MSSLESGIKNAIAACGKDVVGSRRLYGYLSDYHFLENTAVRAVLLAMIDSGGAKSLLQESLAGARDHTAAMQAVRDKLCEMGYNPLVVEHVVDSTARPLGLLDSNYLIPELEGYESDREFIVHFNGLLIKMIRIRGGAFSMGATPEQGIAANFDERPAVNLRLSDFMMAATPVTQRLWQEVMGENPSQLTGLDLPVERVSWYDAQEFCNRLSTLTGLNFHLPTEAQWEYAARGGQLSSCTRYAGTDEENADSHIWHRGNSQGRTHNVGTLLPNELGLYDLSGNVSEWCADWYFNSYAISAGSIDPEGPEDGRCKVARGGSYESPLIDCRTSRRIMLNPDHRSRLIGLRLCI